jgi:hypothetical protein
MKNQIKKQKEYISNMQEVVYSPMFDNVDKSVKKLMYKTCVEVQNQMLDQMANAESKKIKYQIHKLLVVLGGITSTCKRGM